MTNTLTPTTTRTSILTHIKENFTLAYPVILSNLGHILMGVSDSVMIGHVDSVSLAAAGLATVAFNVLLLFGIGVSLAITPLVAEARGNGNDKGIVEPLRHGLIINLINGVLLVMLVVAGKNILYHINQPEEVVARAIPYLSIITYSLIPVLIYQTFKQFAEGLSKTQIAMVIVIATNVVNIGLNYIFIYGYAGIPAMGLNGAGWATFISRCVMAIVIVAYIYYAPAFRKYRAGFSIGKYSKKLFTKMLNIGIPSGAQFIFEVAAFDFSLVMMGWLGTATQAAHQIVINLATISYMTTSGLAAAATVRVGYFLGSKDGVNLRLTSYTLLGMALTLMSAWAVLFIFANHWLPTLYVNDAEVITIATSLLVIAGLFQLSDGTQVVCNAALRGMQDVKVPSFFIFISYWVIGLPLGYWLAFPLGYGAMGVWMGLLIGLTLTAIAMFIRLNLLLRPLAQVRVNS